MLAIHPQARTNLAASTEIARSQGSSSVLAKRSNWSRQEAIAGERSDMLVWKDRIAIKTRCPG
jgi:hypothetical protein